MPVLEVVREVGELETPVQDEGVEAAGGGGKGGGGDGGEVHLARVPII
jgi:hypothetical protein